MQEIPAARYCSAAPQASLQAFGQAQAVPHLHSGEQAQGFWVTDCWQPHWHVVPGQVLQLQELVFASVMVVYSS